MVSNFQKDVEIAAQRNSIRQAVRKARQFQARANKASHPSKRQLLQETARFWTAVVAWKRAN